MSSYSPESFEGLQFHQSVAEFQSGRSSPREFLEHCLGVIAEKEESVKAWVVINEQGAREQADRSSQRWRVGKPLSPIDGMPIGIKDLLETKDMPTQMGCAAYAGNFPPRDNAAVWALREAGAIILGKTVTTELGGSQPGPTTNPFDPAHIPGGSSSGTAAAVAAGMVPASVGSQVLGSMIRPSSYCGNWTLKPSQGAITRGERQSTSLSTHGIHSNSLIDTWTVSIEIAKRAGGDPGRMPLDGPYEMPDSYKPAVVAVIETEGWDEADGTAKEAFLEIVDQLEAKGVRVLRRSTDSDIAEFEEMLIGVQEMTNKITSWETHWSTGSLIARYPNRVSQRAKDGVKQAEDLGAAGYAELLHAREKVCQAYRRLSPMIDAVVQLSAPGPAPLQLSDLPGEVPVHYPTGDPVFNTPSSLLGAPAVNVPLMAVNGLPVGFQFVGQQMTDARMMAIARWAGAHLTPVSKP